VPAAEHKSSGMPADLLRRAAALVGIPGTALVAMAPLFLGWLVMFMPTYYALSTTIWASDEQGHGPIILGVTAWLLFRKLPMLAAIAPNPYRVLGLASIAVGLLSYTLGRAQYIWTLEVGAQHFILAGLVLYYRGPATLRQIWFPLLFLVFMIPLPADLVAAITAPLKSAVSVVSANVLYFLGYPVARSGVVLTIGPFQLLVADACAGLNSLFTLEALGLFYLNLMNYSSAARSITLAILIVPISFMANVVRVIILVLVTYHFGDAAGQGFVHGFAGMVLFMVALILMLAADKALGFIFRKAGS
jgi:exosortase B